MDEIKVVKQDGIKREFHMSNGDIIKFEDYNVAIQKPKTKKKKKTKEVKLDLDDPIKLAEFKHGEGGLNDTLGDSLDAS